MEEPGIADPPVGASGDKQADANKSAEFVMYEYKIRQCTREDGHDWATCPFAHPGERSARRCLRKYNYSSVACSIYRKGVCRVGDACQFAHGVFESWLHPERYRTQMCLEGSACTRRMCFFAHSPEELREATDRPTRQHSMPGTFHDELALKLFPRASCPGSDISDSDLSTASESRTSESGFSGAKNSPGSTPPNALSLRQQMLLRQRSGEGSPLKDCFSQARLHATSNAVAAAKSAAAAATAPRTSFCGVLPSAQQFIYQQLLAQQVAASTAPLLTTPSAATTTSMASQLGDQLALNVGIPGHFNRWSHPGVTVQVPELGAAPLSARNSHHWQGVDMLTEINQAVAAQQALAIQQAAARQNLAVQQAVAAQQAAYAQASATAQQAVVAAAGQQLPPPQVQLPQSLLAAMAQLQQQQQQPPSTSAPLVTSASFPNSTSALSTATSALTKQLLNNQDTLALAQQTQLNPDALALEMALLQLSAQTSFDLPSPTTPQSMMSLGFPDVPSLKGGWSLPSSGDNLTSPRSLDVLNQEILAFRALAAGRGSTMPSPSMLM